MIQKMSDEHKINFLEKKENIDIPEKNQVESEKTLAQLAEEQKAKKMNNKDNGLMTSKNIRSAVSGVIREEGGPSKFIKSETSNTIWENNKSERISKEIDSKTRVKEEKEQIASNKRIAEEKRMNELVNSLKETEQRKSATISPSGNFSGSTYNAPKNNMSIFDNKEFERVEEKTAGEKVTEENKKKLNQKDESYKNSGKQVSSKDFVNRFFDNLLNNEKK